MFKDIQRGLEKFFTKERVLVIIVFLIFAWVLFSYSGSKTYSYDGFAGPSSYPSAMPQAQLQAPAPKPQAQVQVQAQPQVQPQMIPGSVSHEVPPSNNGLQPVANPSDLLPVDQNSQWSALNPNTMNQGSVLMPDLLQAGYHIGLDTIGQTLRNANLQLRSDPVIPKQNVSPWLMSTIEPDLGRTPLELGVGPQ